jgi:hypothetical protein
MDQVDDVWMRRLLQISSDIHYRMGEVRKLRQLVRQAEASAYGQEPSEPVVEDNELRAQPDI